MKYAIETLEIELNKNKEARRIETRYVIYPEYISIDTDFLSIIIELEKAIKILKEKEQEK